MNIEEKEHIGWKIKCTLGNGKENQDHAKDGLHH